MFNLFKKEKSTTIKTTNKQFVSSENLSLDEEYANFVKRYTETLKDKFTSKDIVNKFHIKDKELHYILSKWIAKLVEESEIDLILTGKNNNGDYVFLRGDLFDRILQSKLNLLDNLSNENKTYQFLQDVSGSKDVNIEILKSEIERKMKPLVKFDDGSRNMPVMLNLCRFKVPETDVFISEEILQKFNISEENNTTESKKVKKMMFTSSSKNSSAENAEDIIITAFSLLLKETGKLILTKNEIKKTRAYKVFFSSLDFDVLIKLANEVFKYSPVTTSEYISFYPENWLDLKVIKEQIEKEGEQSPAMGIDTLINQNYAFLSKEEIKTLKSIIDIPIEVEKKSIEKVKEIENFDEKNKDRAATIKPTGSDQLEKETKIVSKTDVEKKETIVDTKRVIPQESQNRSKKLTKKLEKDRRKNKIEPSEPLKFLDSMIVNENNKEQSTAEKSQALSEIASEEKTEIIKPNIKDFDKNELHYIIRILDSTTIDSGYYSHQSYDNVFEAFIEKIRRTGYFRINTEEDNFKIKRNENCSQKDFEILRNEIEEFFLSDSNTTQEDFIIEKGVDENISKIGEELFTEENDKKTEMTILPDDETENSDEAIQNKKEDFLLIPDEKQEPDKNDAIKKDSDDYDNLKDSLLEGLMIDNEVQKYSEETEFNKNKKEDDDFDDDMNFEIEETSSLKSIPTEEIEHSEVYEIIQNNFIKKDQSFVEEIEENTDISPTEEAPEEVEVQEESPAKEDNAITAVHEEENLLEGKIISVLTDDEENWLKIEMMSKMLGFELRDGLAYRPDIAIFDDSYKHLEPIARNSGAMIMQLPDFMKRIGLSK